MVDGFVVLVLEVFLEATFFVVAFFSSFIDFVTADNLFVEVFDFAVFLEGVSFVGEAF